MCLVIKYKKYVEWCDAVGAHPIGFVNWKAKKNDCSWDRKKHTYIRNTDLGRIE